jgi:ferric-dicitrate binding protein FerR (iron transport regulator)
MSDPHKDEDPIERLLRHSTPRSDPPEDATRRTHAAVMAAWEDLRRRRARVRLMAAAASLALILVGSGAWLVARRPAPELARVERVQGEVHRVGGPAASALVIDGTVISAGQRLVTAADGGLTLRRASGLTLRVGASSELSFGSRDSFEMLAGIVYIDTGSNTPSRDPLAVMTRAGRVQHVGTRFSVAVAREEVRIAVRDGKVNLARSNGNTLIGAGEEARIGADGRMETQRLASNSAVWKWLDPAPGPIAIDDRVLFDVMAELGAAAGLAVRYATPAVETEAHQLRLRGPPLTLPTDAAIDGVLLATRFKAARRDGSLEIDLR